MKTVTFHRNDDADLGLSSFHDVTINASLEKLTQLFDVPTDGDGGYKTKHEWTLEGDDGTVIAIYDYRFDGAREGYWHIDGADKLACLKFTRWFNAQ